MSLKCGVSERKKGNADYQAMQQEEWRGFLRAPQKENAIRKDGVHTDMRPLHSDRGRDAIGRLPNAGMTKLLNRSVFWLPDSFMERTSRAYAQCPLRR